MPGAGTSKSTQNTVQSQGSNTDPWSPTIAPLQNIIAGINPQIANATPNAIETGALGQLANVAQNTPNYVPQATNLANSLLNGGGANGNIGTINSAYSALQGQLNPIASAPLDPTQTPGIANLLSTIRSDVSNQINGQFAGAGRDLSGLNQQALARGISQGEAVPLLNQYNQNVQNAQGAANSLFDAGNTTANNTQNLAQTGYGNIANGLQSGYVSNAAAAQPLNQLQAAATARNLPISNLAGVLGLTLPIAGLGGSSQSHGTSNTQGTQTMSPVQAFSSLFGGQGGGAVGNFGQIAGNALSKLAGFFL